MGTVRAARCAARGIFSRLIADFPDSLAIMLPLNSALMSGVLPSALRRQRHVRMCKGAGNGTKPGDIGEVTSNLYRPCSKGRVNTRLHSSSRVISQPSPDICGVVISGRCRKELDRCREGMSQAFHDSLARLEPQALGATKYQHGSHFLPGFPHGRWEGEGEILLGEGQVRAVIRVV